MNSTIPTRESGCDEAVAVIVIHGVSDPKPGETARAVSQQLAAISDACVTGSHCTVAVKPIESALAYPEQRAHDWQARFRKSFEQSLRSDFVADGPAKSEPPARAVGAFDPGSQFTDYVFWKARHGTSDPTPPAGASPHEAACFEIRGGRRTDVFEMYWADLSRLSGAAPRILTELFTLLFNLSRLGAQAVALAATLNPGNRALHWLSKAQRSGDWLYSRIFATIILQLIVCSAMLFAATLPSQSVRWLAIALVVAAPICFAVDFVLRKQRRGFDAYTVVGLAVQGFLVSSLIGGFSTGACLVVVWVCGLGIQERLFDFWERRFRGVYGCGLFGAFTTFAAGCWGVLEHGSVASGDAWAFGALRAVDVMLVGVVLFWLLMPFVLTAMMICGSLAVASGGTHSSKLRFRNSVGTGRLGLLLSLGAFMAFGQVLWALINDALQSRVADITYRSLRLDGLNSFQPATQFLTDRYENATMMFSLISICVGLVVLQMAITLLPSIVIELRLVRGNVPRRLKTWLTSGYRLFDGAIGVWAYFFLGVIWLGVALTTIRVWYRGHDYPVPCWVIEAYDGLHSLSAVGLAWVVVPLVGAATGIIAIGGLAWKWLRRIRVPVDIVLDVDNHFREFPRHAIPRVVIFERYVALLELVLARGYRRIVIVAHSQGSVITAELLRYLHQRASLNTEAADRLAELARGVSAADVTLFTVGTPLRQLYARRFPDLYEWVAARTPNGGSGPDATSLGIKAWINRWGAADYVGRWLWEPSGSSTSNDRGIGAEAHTHYFEADQKRIVRVLDVLTR